MRPSCTGSSTAISPAHALGMRLGVCLSRIPAANRAPLAPLRNLAIYTRLAFGVAMIPLGTAPRTFPNPARCSRWSC